MYLSKEARQRLFEHCQQDHNITLVESEMDDIARIIMDESERAVKIAKQISGWDWIPHSLHKAIDDVFAKIGA